MNLAADREVDVRHVAASDSPDFEGPPRDLHERWHADVPSSLSQRALAFFIVVFPIIVLSTAAVFGVATPRPLDISMMLVGFAVTGIGISVGFHRYFTHRSFETIAPVAFALGVMGSMAWQGPVLEWAEVHRRHHRHSDCDDDPHTPHRAGAGLWNIVKGAMFAHQGWMFAVNIRTADMARYSPDLRRSMVVHWLTRLHYVWAVCGLLVPGLFAYLVNPSWESVWLGVLWGGVVRTFLLNHITWCVNSVCHMWGAQDYCTSDQSRNNVPLGLIALGEGWHNNHHAFPTSARLGLKPWQFDAGWAVIQALQACRLVWNVRTPDPDRLAVKQKSHSLG